MKKEYHHLTEIERGKISALLSQGYSIYKIAKILKRAYNTIRNEVQRGTTTIIVDSYKDKTEYFPERGQAIYENNRRNVARKPKLLNDKYSEFLKYVEQQFFETRYSLAAIYHTALKEKRFKKDNMVCVGTLYSYIDKGYMNIKNIDLPEKVSRKPKKQNNPRMHKRLYGSSIEKRRRSIETRKQFGHWEIDTVIGKQGKNENVFLVMTERKSRMEIIRKLENKTNTAVMTEIDKLIKEYGDNFKNIFKTITTDNGTEFSKLHTLEEKTGTKVFYAHPYSSFERGSNERNNRIIRQFIKKGTSFNNVSKENLQDIEKWVNNLPRRMFGYKSANEIFKKEIKKAVPKAAIA